MKGIRAICAMHTILEVTKPMPYKHFFKSWDFEKVNSIDALLINKYFIPFIFYVSYDSLIIYRQ